MEGRATVRLTIKTNIILAVILFCSNSMTLNYVEATDELDINVEDGVIEDTFSYEDVITEEVYVDTGVDTDGDGEEDKVYVKVERPQETADEGQVPIIYNMSSYNGGLPYPEYHDVDEELYEGKPAAAPTLDDYYASYFVPKGYAVVTANNIGTEHSDGCPSTGSEDEIQAAKAVIDWLNHRADAQTEDGDKVEADWSTGDVGMIGKSYDGSLANGVAATGVEGLKTIVPIAAISNWYDYYRGNGAVIAPGGYQGDDADRLARGVLTRDNPEVCDNVLDEIEEQQERTTGNYNEFWEERNYLKDASQIEASVFLVHGLQDTNVQPSQATNLWEALKEHDVPRKMWLHQGEHDDPKDIREEQWLTAINKWFAYWLYDINNDIMDESVVEVEKSDNTWEKLEEWPRPGVENKTLYPQIELEDAIISLQTEKLDSSEGGAQVWTDDASVKVSELIKKPLEELDNRLAYISPALQESMNLSGTPELTLEASFDRPAANLSAVLVDYGPGEKNIVTRGWVDPRNKESLSKDSKLKKNKPYQISFDMEAYEYEFKEGHQIGLVILASDHEYTKRPEPGSEITLYPEKSQITLPLTGDFNSENNHSNQEEAGENTSFFSIILTVCMVVVLGFLWFALRRMK